MILLWGVEGDPPLGRVAAALEAAGLPWELVDQRQAAETRVEYDVATLDGLLEAPGSRIRLGDVRGVYVRPYGLADLFDDPQESGRAAAVQQLLWAWCELTGATVLNRPSAMASNGSKPFQARYAEAVGFATPPTLLTTDPDAVGEFRAAHGAVVYKSVSGVRSIVAELGSRDIGDVRWCPTQFQRRVPGVDHRVHVVGDRLFACAVECDGVDYRYSDYRVIPCELPGDVAERCLRLSRVLDLPLTGIDLRLAPDGTWYCFEANPSPAFSCYEAATGHDIAGAIAELFYASSAAPFTDRPVRTNMIASDAL